MYCNPNAYKLTRTFSTLPYTNRTFTIDPRKSYPQAVIDETIKIVSKYFDITSELLKTQSRKRDYVAPRQIIMYLLAQNKTDDLPLTYKMIGNEFGRDHSTVIYAEDTVEDLMSTDKKFKLTVYDLSNKLNFALKTIQKEYRILHNS